MEQLLQVNLSAKNSIIKSFLNLLALDSFEQISVTKIVQHAHVNRSTFYKHFHSKYDLMDQVSKLITSQFLSFYHSDRWSDNHEKASTQTTTEKICEHILAFRHFYKHEFENPTYIYQLSYDLSGELMNIYGSRSYAIFSGFGTIGYLSWWIKEGFPISPKEAAEELIIIGSTDWSQMIKEYFI